MCVGRRAGAGRAAWADGRRGLPETAGGCLMLLVRSHQKERVIKAQASWPRDIRTAIVGNVELSYQTVSDNKLITGKTFLRYEYDDESQELLDRLEKTFFGLYNYRADLSDSQYTVCPSGQTLLSSMILLRRGAAAAAIVRRIPTAMFISAAKQNCCKAVIQNIQGRTGPYQMVLYNINTRRTNLSKDCDDPMFNKSSDDEAEGYVGDILTSFDVATSRAPSEYALTP
ncbi:jg11756 [Pararge aegeria aegeria]|uniref:Jg11756 protein n=1 Tax=Pararge aegeria aegeria TaxID=348720 RepID=A0A8S4RZT2_9NEOP|nr:jg11756 [Pararge aegeria aegeria]